MALSKVISIFNTLNLKASRVPRIPQQVWSNPLYFVAFGFGSGAFPIVPGTFGTLMAIPFYLYLASLPLETYLLFVGCFILVSMWICSYISRATMTHDHPGMNIDEFAGFFVAMINAPLSWGWIVYGFILFRLFDIWKPWPIYIVDERMTGGIGMVLDDVLAGLFTLLIIQTTKLYLV